MDSFKGFYSPFSLLQCNNENNETETLSNCINVKSMTQVSCHTSNSGFTSCVWDFERMRLKLSVSVR